MANAQAGKPGRVRRPTISDVARRAGVSIGAVSFVMNGRPGVGASTAERIRESARELGWMPSVRARALTRARSQTIGMVLCRPAELIGTDPFFSGVIAGVEKVLAAEGYALLLRVVEDPQQEVRSYRSLAGEARVDGFLLTDLRQRDLRVNALTELGAPAVVVGRPSPSVPFPALGSDDRTAMRAIVDHLVELGHTNIAHVSGIPGYIHTEARRSALLRGLSDAGLTPGPVVNGEFSAPGGARATEEVLSAGTRPTAIVYANDLMAIAGMAAAADLGLRVPQDVSIVGFDDVALAAYVSPGLTTIGRDTIEWGMGCAQTLLRVIDGEPVPHRALLPSHLIVRASTGRFSARRR